MKATDESSIRRGIFNSQIRKVFFVLDRPERRYLAKLVVSQSLLSLLDLLSIFFIGIFVSNALTEDSENRFMSKIAQSTSELVGTNSNYIGALIIAAVMLLLFKTMASIILTRKTLKFFSLQASKMSANLVSFVFSKGIEGIQRKPLQELLFTTTRGVEILTLQIMATIAIMVSDLVLLIILTAGLFFIDTLMALVSILLFGGVTVVLNLLLGKRSTKLGEANSVKSIASNQSIEKLYYSFREMFVKNKIKSETNLIGNTRRDLSETLTEINFFPYIGKYVIETSLALGGAVVALIVFTTRDLPTALSVMAMFLASASRIAPSLLRLQQSYITVRSYYGMTERTLNLWTEFNELEKLERESSDHDFKEVERLKPFIGEILIQDLYFRYSESDKFAVVVDTLEISPGSTVAIVGASGAGKSTLIDLILGILSPQSGSIKISGLKPAQAISVWPGEMAYVPQQIRIFEGSIAENITHGLSLEEIQNYDLLTTVNDSALRELIESSQDGLSMQLGANGTKLSGGQAQRIGIARALLTKPTLIVFDEATSALDSETESVITDTLAYLKGKTTMIIVAHRLSTVQSADVIIYMKEGQIIAKGTFEQVRTLVPNFDKQAQLMGLISEKK